MSIWLYIIILAVIIILGYGHLHLEIHQNRLNIAFIRTYIAQLNSFTKKHQVGENYDSELHFLVSKSEEAQKIFREHTVFPILDFKLACEYHNVRGIEQPIRSIAYEAVEAEEYYNHANYCLQKQNLNPITMFYRGIQLLLKITIGYLILVICPSFSFESGFWKILSIISSICSIAGLVVGIIQLTL